jgi:zinc protease
MFKPGFAPFWCAAALVAVSAVSGKAASPAPALHIEIPYQKFVLDNGLTLIVHEDRKAPIVAVNVWYHVGSKDEKKGKTGFAHLFEHLMFNGSEHFNQDYFKVLERLGATDLNGTTNHDRTNYFQTVPVSALETVLWMESDRMGHLLGAIDQAKLDEQRGVVKNEKRQGDNQPYGLVDDVITENTWPAGHPYSWSVIGSMEDLDAATLEDVREWFRTYYGPSNAVLVLAGDVDAKRALALVEKYFGAIPPGPPVRRHGRWIAKMSGERRAVLEDRVPQARIYKVWNTPPIFDTDVHYLDLASDILGAGKTSRLYRRLVYHDQTCTAVAAYIDPREIAGQFTVMASVRPGADPKAVEQAMDEELARFLRDGPTAEELDQVRTRHFADFLRGLERVGGFGGKSDVLARGQVYAGDPGAYRKALNDVAQATPENIRDAARRWLSDGVFVLEVRPFADRRPVSKSDVDRSRVPEPGAPPALTLPKLKRATLSNGLRLVVAERPDLPLVQLQLLVDSGFAADPPEAPGTASLAMAMLDEGTTSRSALEISEELDRLGTQLATAARLDVVSVTASVLKTNLEPSLRLFGEVILYPSFPQEELERQKKQRLAAIQNEKARPFGLALRVLPRLLYGEGHPYAAPLSGSGTEEAVAALTREDLVRFHRSWFHPNNATLIAAGAVTAAELVPMLEKVFGAWKPGRPPERKMPAPRPPQRNRIYLLDRPGAQQSVILGGHLAPPKSNPDEVAIEIMNAILGGQFTSRINMNLREEKHWSYGADTVILDARAERPFLTIAPVETGKTKEALLELIKELRQIRDERPITMEELAAAQSGQTLRLPGSFETLGRLTAAVAEIVTFNLPDDYFEAFVPKVRALTLEEVNRAARRYVHPERMVWVVVGDRREIEASLREAGIGEVALLDVEGRPQGAAD